MKGKREKKRLFHSAFDDSAFSGSVMVNHGGGEGGIPLSKSEFNIPFDDVISDGKSLRF